MKFIEVFSTWQGEGPDSGKRMLLTRFKECDRVDGDNKPPCYYCDTLVKMRTTVEAEYSLAQLQQTIDEEKLGLMITGGEPTYSENLNETLKLIDNLKVHGPINIETNGCDLIKFLTLLSTDRVAYSSNQLKIMLSPKIFGEKDIQRYFDIINFVETRKKEYDNIYFYPLVYYKLVYTNNEHTNLLNDNFLQALFFESVYEPHKRVYLMPEGKTKEELLKSSSLVFDKCEEWKVNFSSRDHIVYSFI
jgi:organic radical activating enzyme